MNLESNTSGTNTSMTLLDDSVSHDEFELTNEFRTTTPSISSSRTSTSIPNTVGHLHHHDTNGLPPNMINSQILNHIRAEFVLHTHCKNATAESICIEFCKIIKILPTIRLLFALRVYDSSDEWLPAAATLKPNVKYEFRMRFKVPSLGSSLLSMDAAAYEYLYRQMRHDMIREWIPEIRYPLKKDNVMGLGVLDMYIDSQGGKEIPDIEANYKRYLPRKLIKAHKVFVKPKICSGFRQFRGKSIDVERVKLNYVNEIHNLAPSYLIETFKAFVDYIPDSEERRNYIDRVQHRGQGGHMGSCEGPCDIPVFVKLDLFDTTEPGLKIATFATEDKLQVSC